MKKAKPDMFDPFASRLARDVRNGLSESFLKALEETDPTVYRCRAEKYLAQSMAQPYQTYVRRRLAKYDEVFIAVIPKMTADNLKQAGIFWEHGLYYEMHELLEKLWLGAEGARRRALQGLIRAAGMKIHAENRNLKAALTMGKKALSDLELFESGLADFPGLATITAEVNRTLAGLEQVAESS